MRLLLTVLAFLAMALFVVASLASALLNIVVPLALAALLVTAGVTTRAVGLLRLVRPCARLTVSGFFFARFVTRMAAAPLLVSEEAKALGQGRLFYPQLWEVAADVARAVGTRMADEIVVTHDDQLGVFESGRLFFGARRHLMLGLPLIYVLSLDELRAVLAHEFGHFARAHNRTTRILMRFVRALAGVLDTLRQSPIWFLSPLYWSTALSFTMVESIYLPLSRLQESDADLDSARAMGANHATSALRKVRDELPAVLACAPAVVTGARSSGFAPERAWEAAARYAARLPPTTRHALAATRRENPLDVEGLTHPPIPVRIGALRGLPTKPPRDKHLAAAYLPDVVDYDRRQTRKLLHPLPSIPTKEFVVRLPDELAPIESPRRLDPAS